MTWRRSAKASEVVMNKSAVAMIQPRLSTRNICSSSPADTRATARQSSSKPRSCAMWPKNACQSTPTPTARRPKAIRDGNRRGPMAALDGATSSSEVSIPMNRPNPKTTPPSTASPIRRPMPVVIVVSSPFIESASNQPEIPQDSFDPGALRSEKGRKVGRRLVHIDPAPFFQEGLPLLATHHLAQGLVQGLLVRRPQLRRRHQPTPVDQRGIDALLLERRYVDAKQPLGRRDADGPQLPRLDLLRHLVQAAGRDRQMAAHNLRQHLAAGPRDDVVHLGDIPAAGFDDQGAQNVVRAAKGESAPAHRDRV